MRERKLSANGILIFLVYGMFALFSLLLVVIGARVYRTVAAAGEEHTVVRTSFSYLANKLRMDAGVDGTVHLEEREGIPVLVLRTSVQTEDYETLIYYYDGMLWEYFGTAGQLFSPGAGEKLIEVADFTIEEPEPGLFYLELVDAFGKKRSLHLGSRSPETSRKEEVNRKLELSQKEEAGWKQETSRGEGAKRKQERSQEREEGTYTI